MTNKGLFVLAAAGCAMAIAAPLSPASAQWEMIERQGIPKKADGTFDADAAAPTMPDGKPDFSGVWRTARGQGGGFRDTNYDTDGIPYKPWAKALVKRRFERGLVDDPGSRCLPIGTPMLMYNIPPPREIIQKSDVATVLFETSGVHATFRQVFLDGRALPDNPYPSYMGFSVGRWEGDTMVIESMGYNGKIWVDPLGRPTTEQLRVTERWSRPKFGRMEVDITIDDPGAYDAPWTFHRALEIAPAGSLTDTYCDENNFDEQVATVDIVLDSVDSRDFMPADEATP